MEARVTISSWTAPTCTWVRLGWTGSWLSAPGPVRSQTPSYKGAIVPGTSLVISSPDHLPSRFPEPGKAAVDGSPVRSSDPNHSRRPRPHTQVPSECPWGWQAALVSCGDAGSLCRWPSKTPGPFRGTGLGGHCLRPGPGSSDPHWGDVSCRCERGCNGPPVSRID